MAINEEEFAALLAYLGDAINNMTNAAYLELLKDTNQISSILRNIEGDYYTILADTFSQALGLRIGVDYIRQLPVSKVSLSALYYENVIALTEEVEAAVLRHTKSLIDINTFMLELFDGYNPNRPNMLVMSQHNSKLPKYLKEALAASKDFKADMSALVKMLSPIKTPALKAAYTEALEAAIAAANPAILAKKLEFAFYERMRFFAKRIAVTELSRSWSKERVKEFQSDDELEYVRYRLSVKHPIADICDLMAKQNKYGLGAGIYPKNAAPRLPMHPFCHCVLVPARSVSGEAKLDPYSERNYLKRLADPTAARILGSIEKYNLVKQGVNPLDVFNIGKDPEYAIGYGYLD